MAAAATIEFTTAFQGLANHLFPDGCPEQHLESLWPHYDRTVPTPTETLKSYEQVVNFSLRNGLSSLQLQAMTVTALCMLPQSKYKGFLATNAYFAQTVQAIIPRERIPVCVVERFMSGVTASPTGRCVVLQFLYLATSYGCFELEFLEKRYYSFFVHWAIQAETCNDSVRLLLLMSPRQRYSRRLHQQKERPGLASLSLLLQVYTGVSRENHLRFYNREWEASFQRFHKPAPIVNISLSDLDYSWNAYQLSKVSQTKPSTTHSRSILIDRWFQGSDSIQKNLLETMAFSSWMDDFLLQHVLPLWDGRNAALLMYALPLKQEVFPYLERHFLFGSPAVQYAIGEYMMRFVEEEASDCVSEIVSFASDLFLRALMIDFSSVVVYIAFDFLDKCPFPPDPFLFYLLALSTGNWDRVCKLIVRYKNENWIDDQVLDQMMMMTMISNIQQLLFGGSHLQDLCVRETVKTRLAAMPHRYPADLGSESTTSTSPSERADALKKDWPEVYHFWKTFVVSGKLFNIRLD